MIYVFSKLISSWDSDVFVRLGYQYHSEMQTNHNMAGVQRPNAHTAKLIPANWYQEPFHKPFKSS